MPRRGPESTISPLASRRKKGPLTWPEGNGWIIRRLLDRLGAHVRTGALVRRIAREGCRLRVVAEPAEYLADVVIFAAPTFLAPYLMEEAPSVGSFEYFAMVHGQPDPRPVASGARPGTGLG